MELTINSINKSFGTKHVLNNVSFTVTAGKALGYLGRNGAGKTTTIRILTDIFRPDSGTVLLDGKPINYSKIRIGYLPEERGLYQKSKILEQMVYIGELRGMTNSAAKKSSKDLLEYLDVSEHYNKKLETLSKGNQQKIQLAIAILHDPEIIILDEPFSGLDPVNATVLKSLIMREVSKNKILLFSSHQMPYVEEFCEHICIINQGSIIVDGKIKDIKRNYPRDKVAISARIEPAALLEKISALNSFGQLALNGEVKGDNVVLTLREPENSKLLFQTLAEVDTNIEMVQVIEPTLEEIFVEKAGDSI